MADCSPYIVQLRHCERLLKDLYNAVAVKSVGWLSTQERQLLDSCEFYFSGLEVNAEPGPPFDDVWVDPDWRDW